MFIPRLAQYHQRLGLKRLLHQRKHGAFFLVEVRAIGGEGRLQPRARLREVPGGRHLVQQTVELHVVMVETVQPVLLVEDVIESDVSQIPFRATVLAQQAGHKAADQRDFVYGPDRWQSTFDLIKQHREHPVFRHQSIDDRHDWRI